VKSAKGNLIFTLFFLQNNLSGKMLPAIPNLITLFQQRQNEVNEVVFLHVFWLLRLFCLEK